MKKEKVSQKIMSSSAEVKQKKKKKNNKRKSSSSSSFLTSERTGRLSTSSQTLSDFVRDRGGIVLQQLFPLGCCCDPKESTLAFGEGTDENKVEAGLYPNVTNLKRHRILDGNSRKSSEEVYYKSYGTCVFCELSLYTIMFLHQFYFQEIEEEKVKPQATSSKEEVLPGE